MEAQHGRRQRQTVAEIVFFETIEAPAAQPYGGAVERKEDGARGGAQRPRY
jgi:hypothetical protein